MYGDFAARHKVESTQSMQVCKCSVYVSITSLTRQRSLPQVVIKLADGVAKAIEDSELISGRHDVDVADLLRFRRVALPFGDNPQPGGRNQQSRDKTDYIVRSGDLASPITCHFSH